MELSSSAAMSRCWEVTSTSWSRAVCEPSCSRTGLAVPASLDGFRQQVASDGGHIREPGVRLPSRSQTVGQQASGSGIRYEFAGRQLARKAVSISTLGGGSGYELHGRRQARLRSAIRASQQTLERSIDSQEKLEESPAASVDDDSDVLIELKNVHKAFGSKVILAGANFKIRRGEAVGIIGPSGTGKSTILKIMAGLLAPDEGEVYICGKKRVGLLSDQSEKLLNVGMVFQSAALFDSHTVGRNVGFNLYEHSELADDVIEDLVKKSLAAVGLKNIEHLYPAALSGGMKKRVALARAIITDGSEHVGKKLEQVVMYDEPTAGLDPIASTVVEDLIRHLHTPDEQGVREVSSYIVVTHQHSTIRRATDRLVFLNKGIVAWEGRVAEFDTSAEPLVRQFATGSLDGPIKW